MRQISLVLFALLFATPVHAESDDCTDLCGPAETQVWLGKDSVCVSREKGAKVNLGKFGTLTRLEKNFFEVRTTTLPSLIYLQNDVINFYVGRSQCRKGKGDTIRLYPVAVGK